MATTITRDQMIAKFEEIDSTYSVFYSAIYPDMILTRKEGTARTDAALTTLATALVKEKSTLSAALTTEKAAVLAAYDAKLAALSAEKTAKFTAAEQKKTKKLADLESDVLHRGMTLSAWYLAEKAQIADEKTAEEDAATAEYNQKSADLTAEKTRVSAEYDTKISQATAAYQQALADKKEELRLADEKLLAGILEYNNKMTEDEINYNKAAADSVFKQANEDVVTRTSMMYEKLNVAYQYLNGFTASAAVTQARTDTVFNKYLGAYGQKALVNHYEAIAAAQ